MKIKHMIYAGWNLIKANILACWNWIKNGWIKLFNASWKMKIATVTIAILLALAWPLATIAFATQAIVDGVDMEIGTIIILLVGTWIGFLSVFALEIIIILSLPSIHNFLIKYWDGVKEYAKREAILTTSK